jgi:hypothetical protein
MRDAGEGGLGLTSGRYMHVRLCSDGLETTTEDNTTGPTGSSVPQTCSGSTRRDFSLAKECPLPLTSPSSDGLFAVGGGRRSSDDLAVASSSILLNDKDSAEQVTTILGSAWPSSRASFSSSSSMWTISSGSPLAGTRRLQRRPSASQIS